MLDMLHDIVYTLITLGFTFSATAVHGTSKLCPDFPSVSVLNGFGNKRCYWVTDKIQELFARQDF